jgi:D-alanyl-D-alanine endopeptidase (penicillin-binding protein 7)
MITRLTAVFVAFLAAAPFSLAAAQVTAAAAAEPWVTRDASKLRLASANALVLDASADREIYAKGADAVTPIASVTKLMTAMVVLDAKQPEDELIGIDMGDLDLLKGSHSRLRLGTELPRHEMLRLALMASENRAASSLARHYPGGSSAFIAAMNAKARELGMMNTHFSDPTGLSSENVSTAYDLARMVRAASEYSQIREFTTTPSHYVELQPTGQLLGFNNTNSLVKSSDWDISVSKTGFIREAGKCLVMLATIASRPVIIVLLDSYGRLTRVGDAMRVKHWLETGQSLPPAQAATRSAKPRRVSGKLMPTRART